MVIKWIFFLKNVLLCRALADLVAFIIHGFIKKVKSYFFPNYVQCIHDCNIRSFIFAVTVLLKYLDCLYKFQLLQFFYQNLLY